MKSTVKKTFLNHLFLFISITICASCRDSNEYISINNPTEFTESSFPSDQDLCHKIHNDEFIGNPVRLTRIDTLLFAVDSKTDTIIHVLSTNNNNYVCNIIPRGAGPGELLSVGLVRQGNISDKFWAYDITRKLWQEGNLDPLSLRYVPNRSLHFTNTVFDKYEIEDPTWISNHSFICTSLINYQERFMIFNDENKLIQSVQNPYLIFNDKITGGILSEMSSTLSDVKPDKSKLVLVGIYLNYIEIYNLDENKIEHHLRGPKNSNPVFDENRSSSLNTMVKSNNTVKTFLCVRCSDEKIYALYSGRERNDPSGYTNSNIIYSFKWDGTPLARYKLDTDISSFDIDEANSMIYAIKYPENSIISFQI